MKNFAYVEIIKLSTHISSGLGQIPILIDKYSYYSIFVIIYISELGIPLPFPAPNGLILLYSGYKVYLGSMNITYVLLAGITADVLGAFSIYLIFYFLSGTNTVKKIEGLLLKNELKENLRKTLNRESGVLIFLLRLVPLVRVYLSAFCGIIRVPPIRFLVSVIPSSIIWDFVIIYIGIKTGPGISKFLSFINNYTKITSIGALLISVLIIIYIIYLMKKNRVGNGK